MEVWGLEVGEGWRSMENNSTYSFVVFVIFMNKNIFFSAERGVGFQA